MGTVTASNKIQSLTRARVQGCMYGFTARQSNGCGGQSANAVGVIWRVGAQVFAAYAAFVLIAHAIDYGGICLQPHALLQPPDKYARYLIPLVGSTGFALYNGGHNQSLVCTVVRQALGPALPLLGKHRFHAAKGTPEQIKVRFAAGKQVSVGEKTPLGMLSLSADSFHYLSIRPFRRKLLEALSGREG